jgi:peptidyl-prolyl cis-trans isomerase SurA
MPKTKSTSMKKLLLTLWIAGAAAVAHSQTVFTYGPYKVDKTEFLRAFNKNNQPESNREAALKDYAELYSHFKLKVLAAKNLHMDTLPNQKSDLLNFETQLQETFLNGDRFMADLVHEAFVRSKTDVELAHLFISATNENELAQAKQQIDKAYNDLKNGLSFEKAVDKYVANANFKQNNGYIGYITAFTLPYPLETLVYNLPTGGFSTPYKSKAGYHIFKKISERPAIGSLQVAQILLAYPEGITEEEKKEKKILADSIYKALLNGASFSALVKEFSEDKFTYQNGGELPVLTLGKYDPVFEKAAFSIPKEGGYAAPVETSTGIHILLLRKKIPAKTDEKDPEQLAYMQQQVRLSDRMLVAQEKQLEEILKRIHYKKIPFNEKQLWTLSDSALAAPLFQQYIKSVKKAPLFSFAKQQYTNTDWLVFIRGRNDGAIRNNATDYYKKQLNEFVKYSAEEYYKKHLADYEPEYNSQVQEFKEGNLLFEIMEKKIWNKAGTDTVGLKNYYQAHKEKYIWEPSVDAIIITAADTASMEAAMKKIKADAGSWKNFVNEWEGKVQADSGRFEMSQIPVVERTNFEKGLLTHPLQNEQDGSVVFAYIVNVYHQPAPRSFEEARGLVINDYQQVLEDKWIAELKKKYPVKINWALLKTL